MLHQYAEICGEGRIRMLTQLASLLKGAKVLHVNSTKEGGGVAEILQKLIPFQRALGLDAEWEVIRGSTEFFQCTKAFHNALQGERVFVSEDLLKVYERTNEENADRLREKLAEAHFVFIHDPQPAALIRYLPERRGTWIWRCHIDVSHPVRWVWKYLREIVNEYDASIFSLPEFAQSLPHPQFLIAPSIDPLSEKNIELHESEINAVFEEFSLDSEVPLIVQVSRFDRFKDPLGVIEAARIVHRITPVQLALVGGGAEDDPEGAMVLREVEEAAAHEDNVHVIVLPPDAHRTINAIQRAATIVVQKSLREGFGLTVTEALWKRKPVIGGDTGGIRLQVINHHTGFLVRTPEGAALRIRYLLHERHALRAMGEKGHYFVRENFLLPRLVQDHLAVMVRLQCGELDRIELQAQ